jgi:hypothetical protein
MNHEGHEEQILHCFIASWFPVTCVTRARGRNREEVKQ